jgi:hypothetical protein
MYKFVGDFDVNLMMMISICKCIDSLSMYYISYVKHFPFTCLVNAFFKYFTMQK